MVITLRAEIFYQTYDRQLIEITEKKIPEKHRCNISDVDFCWVKNVGGSGRAVEGLFIAGDTGPRIPTPPPMPAIVVLREMAERSGHELDS